MENTPKSNKNSNSSSLKLLELKKLNLKELKRKELIKLLKQLNLKANGKNVELIARLESFKISTSSLTSLIVEEQLVEGFSSSPSSSAINLSITSKEKHMNVNVQETVEEDIEMNELDPTTPIDNSSNYLSSPNTTTAAAAGNDVQFSSTSLRHINSFRQLRVGEREYGGGTSSNVGLNTSGIERSGGSIDDDGFDLAPEEEEEEDEEEQEEEEENFTLAKNTSSNSLTSLNNYNQQVGEEFTSSSYTYSPQLFNTIKSNSNTIQTPKGTTRIGKLKPLSPPTPKPIQSTSNQIQVTKELGDEVFRFGTTQVQSKQFSFTSNTSQSSISMANSNSKRTSRSTRRNSSGTHLTLLSQDRYRNRNGNDIDKGKVKELNVSETIMNELNDRIELNKSTSSSNRLNLSDNLFSLHTSLSGSTNTSTTITDNDNVKRKIGFEGKHKRVFDKMDSISNHYAAKRTLPNSTSNHSLNSAKAVPQKEKEREKQPSTTRAGKRIKLLSPPPHSLPPTATTSTRATISTATTIKRNSRAPTTKLSNSFSIPIPTLVNTSNSINFKPTKIKPFNFSTSTISSSKRLRDNLNLLQVEKEKEKEKEREVTVDGRKRKVEISKNWRNGGDFSVATASLGSGGISRRGDRGTSSVVNENSNPIINSTTLSNKFSSIGSSKSIKSSSTLQMNRIIPVKPFNTKVPITSTSSSSIFIGGDPFKKSNNSITTFNATLNRNNSIKFSTKENFNQFNNSIQTSSTSTSNQSIVPLLSNKNPTTSTRRQSTRIINQIPFTSNTSNTSIQTSIYLPNSNSNTDSNSDSIQRELFSPIRRSRNLDLKLNIGVQVPTASSNNNGSILGNSLDFSHGMD